MPNCVRSEHRLALEVLTSVDFIRHHNPGSKKHSISLASLLIIEILHSPAPEHHNNLRSGPMPVDMRSGIKP